MTMKMIPVSQLDELFGPTQVREDTHDASGIVYFPGGYSIGTGEKAGLAQSGGFKKRKRIDKRSRKQRQRRTRRRSNRTRRSRRQ